MGSKKLISKHISIYANLAVDIKNYLTSFTPCALLSYTPLSNILMIIFPAVFYLPSLYPQINVINHKNNKEVML